MKRLIAFALLCCLLLCGCDTPDAAKEPNPQTEPATEAATQPVTEPVTESTPTPQEPIVVPTEPLDSPTEPPKTDAKKVTVYLLKNVTYFDSGSVAYHYDENHNIDSYTMYTIENTTMYETFFEEKDANGMACVVRSQWPEDIGNETRNLTYSEDGKLTEELIADSNFSGFQYAYDQAGNRTEKREYYDGILQSAVYYEYDGKLLTAAYCEDNAGNKVFECRIENGLIVEKAYSGEGYGYRYEYDKDNNLIEISFYQDGETIPGDQYFYEAVEVDGSRAQYLQEQQNYLITIA